MLDSMDVMLYAMILSYVQRDLHLTPAVSGGLMSATLIAAAIGGIFFGWFADRMGRTRALSASMLIYSIATALCGFAQTAVALGLFRIVLGLGMGGEWAAGATLVAETWPERHRVKALAFVQSFWAIGYAFGALITAIVLPHFGWRAVFFVGVIPAILTLWIRRSVHEPEIWVKQAASPKIALLFRGKLGYNTLICSTMNAATLFAWWGLFTWMPRFLSMPLSEGGRGLNIVQTSSWIIIMQLGTFLGYISFGYIAERLGAKQTYIAFLLIAAALVPLYAAVHSEQALLLIGPLVGFFGTGYFSGFSAITSSLFPTALRGSAMGFVYNIGRIVSAAAPYAIGRISQHASLGSALSLTAFGFIIAALIATGLRGANTVST